MTLQGSYHQDQNELTRPDGIRYDDQTCEGGTPTARAASRRSPTSISGGFGFVIGLDDHSDSSREQSPAASRSTPATTRSRPAATIMDGRTDAFGFFTGGQQVVDPERVRPALLRAPLLRVSPDDPTLVPDYPPSAQVLDYGGYVQDSWRARARPDDQRRAALGRGADAQLRRAAVLRFNDQWQPRVGVVWDPVARRRDEDLRLRRPLLLRAADGAGRAASSAAHRAS